MVAPEGTLIRALAGDATAKLLVDTWVTLGLEFGTISLALFIASHWPGGATALVWTVLGLELVRGIGTDVYSWLTELSRPKILP